MAAKPIEISVNLIEAALNEVNFLQQVHKDKYLRTLPGIKHAIYRYEQFWLPLLKKVSFDESRDQELVPPLDIQWVWHTHMLCPIQYGWYCNEKFGRSLGHRLYSLQEAEQRRSMTKQLWEEEYSKEPFEIRRDPSIQIPDSKIAYDLVAATQRQKHFYYQVHKYK